MKYVERALATVIELVEHGDMTPEEALDTELRHGEVLTPRETAILRERVEKRFGGKEKQNG